MKFRLFQDSRVGARAYNQDRIGHWRTGGSLLLVLADGMGGHLNGEVAAQLALESMAADFHARARPLLGNPELFIFDSIRRAHASVVEKSALLGLPETPRTTIVACAVQEGFAYWGHVGDSRLYLIRNGRIVTRTRDHSRVQQLIDAGRIREEAAAAHPDRNKLMQCLGSDTMPRLEPTAVARLARDDVLMLCSDGLWGPLTQRQLLHAYVTADFERASRELMALAEKRAGPQCDNVSMIAMAWGEDEVAAAEAPRTLPTHELPTDVQDFTATDPDFLRMSDAEIDRAVDEIRTALRRNRKPG
ncbi:MAG: PP2C family serine/threonine-protein phosphatase [Burkholderiales bacterium]